MMNVNSTISSMPENVSNFVNFDSILIRFCRNFGQMLQECL
ncbi:hypothetical protein BVRB_7g171500 [Beta vulgaris subsp. vulgaris]|nr:hypothetical protein BVRB_7g171500 [Beta vulgaris subsp. vulgaris]